MGVAVTIVTIGQPVFAYFSVIGRVKGVYELYYIDINILLSFYLYIIITIHIFILIISLLSKLSVC